MMSNAVDVFHIVLPSNR